MGKAKELLKSFDKKVRSSGLKTADFGAKIMGLKRKQTKDKKGKKKSRAIGKREKRAIRKALF